jgi:hypothetical protein
VAVAVEAVMGSVLLVVKALLSALQCVDGGAAGTSTGLRRA